MLTMEASSLNCLCCPTCKRELTYPDFNSLLEILSVLSCKYCGIEYPKTNNYFDFLGEKNLVHSSKQEKIVRSLLAKFYTPVTNFMLIFCGGPKKARREVLTHLEIKDNDIVLETGMGPGDNFPFLTT